MGKYKKFNSEMVRELVESEGYELISVPDEEYIKAHDKIELKCNNGHIYNVRLYSYRSGVRCAKCKGLKKYNIAEVRDILRQKKLKLLSTEYKGNKSNLEILCEKGHFFQARLNNIISASSSCPECAGNLKLTYEEVKLYIERNNYTLVSKEYHNNWSKLIVKCDNPNHKSYEVKFNDFKDSNSRCPYCFNEKRNMEKRHSYDYIKNFVEENNHTLISKEYRNSASKIEVQCSNGDHPSYLVRFNDFFSKGVRCPKCLSEKKSRGLKFSHEEISLKIKEIDESYTLCEDSDLYESSSTTKLKIKHEKCGGIMFSTWSSFQQGYRTCGCTGNSKGERMIREYFRGLNVSFKEQITFDDLKVKSKLRYDFGIYNKEKLVALLEYDGHQHFQPITFGGISREQAEQNFIKQQYHDKLKTDYAKNNGIPLFRLSYKDKSKKIEDILDFILEEILAS